MALAQLRTHADEYREFVTGGDWSSYVARMARPACWGDHLTLKAVADSFGVCIYILTSYEDPIIRVQPARVRSQRVLWLSFWAEVRTPPPCTVLAAL